MSLLTDIQAAFPAPKRSQDPRTGNDYCVLGAYCQHLGYGEGWTPYVDFPDPCDMEDILSDMCPGMSKEDAYNLACDIVLANDWGNFPRAWALLGQALPPEQETP